jgi:2-keto-4-pentenoate hydratase/2-oxohepta-3-ene-1,7-dioic acid hydratase in catechol pathway
MEGDTVSYYLKPDTALLRNNQAFYYPNFTKKIHAQICVIFRLCRLGRGIVERFASRYYDAVGAGVLLSAADLLEQNIAERIPWDSAVGFDYSAAVSPDFIDLTHWSDSTLHVNACERTFQRDIVLTEEKGFTIINRLISQLSSRMTLKIGDYIFMPVSSSFEIQRGETIETFFGEKKMLEMEVK